jgi:hypothetical protein
MDRDDNESFTFTIFNEQQKSSEFFSILGWGETCEINSNVLNLINNEVV